METPNDNGKKLDRILSILEGNGPDSPGLITRVGIVERVLYGRENAGGLVVQVQRMTTIKEWTVRTATAAAGIIATLGIQYAIKHWLI